MSDEDEALFMRMSKVYRELPGNQSMLVNKTYWRIWENAGQKTHLKGISLEQAKGISLEQALREHGCLEPEVPPPVTDAGALEYDEIMEGDRVMREQG